MKKPSICSFLTNTFFDYNNIHVRQTLHLALYMIIIADKVAPDSITTMSYYIIATNKHNTIIFLL